MREQLSLLRHLMAKDWRYVRSYALVSWLLALTLWPWLYFVDPRTEMLASLHGYVALLFPALVVVRLVQADAMLSTTSFCLTRPIGRMLMLAAKLGMTATVVVAPAVLLATVPAGLIVTLDRRDYVLALATALWSSLPIGAIAFVAAALTRTLGQALLLAVVLVLKGAVLVALCSWAWALPPRAYADNVMIAAPLMIAVIALGGTWLAYRSRRLAHVVAALGVLALLMLVPGRASGYFRPGLFGLELFDNHGRAPLADSRTSWPQWPISVEVLADSVRWAHSEGPPGRPMKAAVLVRGLPAGFVLVQRSYDASVRAGGEESRQHYVEGAYQWSSGDEVEPAAMPGVWEAALGCASDRIDSDGTVHGEVEILRVEDQLPRELLERVGGSLHFEVVRSYVVQLEDIGAGATMRLPRQSVSVWPVSDAEGRRGFVSRDLRLWFSPFLFWVGSLPSTPIAYFDPAARDCVVWKDEYSRHQIPGLPLEVYPRRSKAWRTARHPQDLMTGGLSAALQMVHIQREIVRTITVPFELDLRGR